MWIDAFIALMLTNAVAHLIIGLTEIRFLCLFGYSSKANIGYALLQTVIGVSVFFLIKENNSVEENGWILGILGVLLPFFVIGRFLVNKWKE